MALQCYNKGCGQKFDSDANDGQPSCQYHPGEPVFHDATKKWSCCGKWSTDFTEFLSIKGCTKGLHTNVKPLQPEKETPRDEVVEQVSKPRMPEPLRKKEKLRPDENEPPIPLKVDVTSSAKSALEKKLAAMAIDGQKIENGESESAIRPGAACKHNGCPSLYDPQSEQKKCVFHPGYPVFHEGCKFWSCCNIKRTDFSDFLKQEGCATGEHVWNTREDERKKQVDCRHDHFQTGNNVTVNIYAKAPVPESCFVRVNRVSADVDITFDGGECNYKRKFVLAGTIDPERSSVKLTGTKVEITLKKADLESWKGLEL